MPELDRIIPTPKTGTELLTHQESPIGVCLSDFWRWSESDLLSNATRGMLAEFIVAHALGINLSTSIREEWAPYDLLSPEGIKVEVKASAYIQSWAQRSFSKIVFACNPTRHWDAETNSYGGLPGRHSDVYVFCLFHHKNLKTLDPLKLEQWVFYVVSTLRLNDQYPSQKTIGFRALEALAHPVGFDRLRESIIAELEGLPGQK